MHLPIKLTIKKNKVRKDGTTLIFLQYCYSATKRIRIGSGIGIPENYWNRKTSSIVDSLPSEYGNRKKLEAELREKLRRAENLLTLHYIAPTLVLCNFSKRILSSQMTNT